MKDYQPHEQRVIDEKAELDDKLTKLSSFIENSPIFKGLEEADKKLLSQQNLAMAEYSEILSRRIQRF